MYSVPVCMTPNRVNSIIVTETKERNHFINDQHFDSCGAVHEFVSIDENI